MSPGVRVSAEVLEAWPGYTAAVVIAEGVTNGPSDEVSESVLAGAELTVEGRAPRPGEVVWRDDLGVTCRRWNWRQGWRTQLTEASTRAFFVFDGLPPLEAGALDAAVDELVGHLRDRSPDVRLRLERPTSAASAARRQA
jgi:hypothetical protein